MTQPKIDPVLLPMIRRVMPSIIAHDIIGVQPMTGPTGLINTLRFRYANAWGVYIGLDGQEYRNRIVEIIGKYRERKAPCPQLKKKWRQLIADVSTGISV